ncbi:ABC transporter permease [Saccharicrinis sp. FJH2]|uniref:ABC transporter permease n=1 Tax=Saccharicrinis sp. FJH65 TaxID=3344659 RepID=UPI0035F48637
MKRFIGFVKKEFLHIFRDPRTMIILFGIPVVQLILFGFVLTTEIKDAKIAILDQAHDDVSTAITNKIASSGFFAIAAEPENDSGFDELFRKGIVKAIVVFEPGFGEKMVHFGNAQMQIISDASEPNTATLITNYITAIVNDYMSTELMKGKAVTGVQPQVRMLYNEELSSSYMFVPGIIAVILMLISAMMTSVTIAREKELGTMEILLASPLKPSQIVLGKVFPYLILSILNAGMILLLGNLIFGVPIRGSVVFMMLEVILYILVALSLGVLISTIVDKQLLAMMLSAFALMLPTMLLSGFIFPIENMPVVLQYLSRIFPPRWFIEIIRAVMLKDAGLLIVWKQTAILIFMIAVILGVSVKKFKTRLE